MPYVYYSSILVETIHGNMGIWEKYVLPVLQYSYVYFSSIFIFDVFALPFIAFWSE